MTHKSNVVPLVTEKRFCVECKYYRDLKSVAMFAIPLPEVCRHPANGKDDPVYGPMDVILPYGRDVGHACGPKGNLFEPRPPGFLKRLFGLAR